MQGCINLYHEDCEDCYSSSVYEEYDHFDCQKAQTLAISSVPYPCIQISKAKNKKGNGFQGARNLNTNKDILTAAVLGPCDGKRSTYYNVHVVDATEVPPTSNTAPVVPTSSHPYPPAPPSESSIFSDWLLNHPTCNRNDPPVPLEVIRRLDYRLRYSV